MLQISDVQHVFVAAIYITRICSVMWVTCGWLQVYDAAVEQAGSEQASEQTTGEDMVTFSVPYLYSLPA